jgi:hypothetical protein
MKTLLLGFVGLALSTTLANAQSSMVGKPRQFKSGMCAMTTPDVLAAGNAKSVKMLFYAYPAGGVELVQPADLTLFNADAVMEGSSVDKMLSMSEGLAFSGSRPSGQIILIFSPKKYGGPNDKSDEWALVFRGQGAGDEASLKLGGPCVFKLFRDEKSAIKAARKGYDSVFRRKQ